MRVNGDEFLGEQNGVTVLLQRLAIALAFDLADAVEDGLDGTEFLNQLHAALVANARRAGDIIDRMW